MCALGRPSHYLQSLALTNHSRLSSLQLEFTGKHDAIGFASAITFTVIALIAICYSGAIFLYRAIAIRCVSFDLSWNDLGHSSLPMSLQTKRGWEADRFLHHHSILLSLRPSQTSPRHQLRRQVRSNSSRRHPPDRNSCQLRPEDRRSVLRGGGEQEEQGVALDFTRRTCRIVSEGQKVCLWVLLSVHTTMCDVW